MHSASTRRGAIWTTDDQVFAIGEHDHVLSEHQAASMRQRTQASVEWGLQARMAPNAAHVLAPPDSKAVPCAL